MLKLFPCSCHAEAIQISRDEEYIEFCIWEVGTNRNTKPTFKHRLQLAWKLLTKGTLYADECLLDLKTAKELANELLTISEV